MLRLPRKCKMHEQKVLPLPRESGALILTRLQSIAPATQNVKMTSHLVSLKRQNEHFVLHTFETKNRRFYASFSYKPIFTNLQKYDILRGFRNFSRQSQNAAPATTFATVCAALTMRSMAKALWTRHKMLRLPRKCKAPHCKVLRLPRENDMLALTRFQSIAPVTRNAKMTSHLVTLKCQNEHFVNYITTRRRRHDAPTTRSNPRPQL